MELPSSRKKEELLRCKVRSFREKEAKGQRDISESKYLTK